MKYSYMFTLSLLMILIFILKVNSLFLKKDIPSNNNIRAAQNKLDNNNIVNIVNTSNNNLITGSHSPNDIKDNRIQSQSKPTNANANANVNANNHPNTNLIIDKMEESILNKVANNNVDIKNNLIIDNINTQNQALVQNKVPNVNSNNIPNKILPPENENVHKIISKPTERTQNTNLDIKKEEIKQPLVENQNQKKIESVSIPKPITVEPAPPVKQSDNTIQYSNVEINAKNKVFTPEYAKPQERHSDMKSAILVTKEDPVQLGITERPNFLSSVIHPHAIKVSTPSHLYDKQENTPTFDLDDIKKKNFFDRMAKSQFSNNPSAIEFGGDNLSESLIINSVNTQPQKQILLQNLQTNNLGKTGDIKSAINLLQVPTTGSINQIRQNTVPLLSTLPDPTPIMIPNSSLSNIQPHQIKIAPTNEQHFNIKVNYNGEVHQSNKFVIPDIKSLEANLQNLDKLNDNELEGVINQMKLSESNLVQSNDEIYKNIKKYEAQNNVILDSLNDDINVAHKELGNMIVEVPADQRQLINQEIEEEFSKSLSGYNINKEKFAHLRELDPKEIFEVTGKIKKELDANDKFYLHGDFNFYS